MEIAVIGGGAAGLMAAGRAAELSGHVTLFEKNDRLGRKLRITGKGRCNVCNNCDIETMIASVPRNPRFLYAALHSFSPQDTMAFFESQGVPLKTERGNRVFPVSDRAADIAEALSSYCDCGGVRRIHAAVRGISSESDGRFALETERGRFDFDRVIVATGGVSYPLTGSTGDGYRFAGAYGIKVVEVSPSLVPLVTEEGDPAEMQGLSLKNTALRVLDTADGKTVYTDFGEMLFTHYGVSGPMILSASAHLCDIKPGRYKLSLDLKPALDAQTLDKRLLSDFAKNQNRDFANSLAELLPQKLIQVIVRRSGIDPKKKINLVTRQERHILTALLKNFTLTVRCARPVREAIVTRGGVDVRALSPKTMEAKKVPGLYFCGEVIDVDAYTGGFNLQIAFSTARLAAENAVF